MSVGQFEKLKSLGCVVKNVDLKSRRDYALGRLTKPSVISAILSAFNGNVSGHCE